MSALPNLAPQKTLRVSCPTDRERELGLDRREMVGFTLLSRKLREKRLKKAMGVVVLDSRQVVLSWTNVNVY